MAELSVFFDFLTFTECKQIDANNETVCRKVVQSSDYLTIQFLCKSVKKWLSCWHFSLY